MNRNIETRLKDKNAIASFKKCRIIHERKDNMYEECDILNVLDAVYGMQEICRAVSYSVCYGELTKPIETSRVFDALAYLSYHIVDELAKINDNME